MERKQQALEALRGYGGKAFVRDLNLPGSAIGWGVTFAALERDGLVEGVYPSVESAGVPKVWTLTTTGKGKPQMEAHRFKPEQEDQFDGALVLARCSCGWRGEWQEFTKPAARINWEAHLADIEDTEAQIEATYAKENDDPTTTGRGSS